MRPCVLSIAGFDPCGGAGVLADCKTFEAFGCSGFSVVTAITHQNESMVYGLQWIENLEIKKQLEALIHYYHIGAVKIGVVRSAVQLQEIVSYLRLNGVGAPIIWDPVLKSTSGKIFFEGSFEDIPFSEIMLLTPNRTELCMLGMSQEPDQALALLHRKCSLYVKNMYDSDNQLENILQHPSARRVFSIKKISNCEKHGSGCVLSSAIAAGLALGATLEKSIEQAEEYMRNFLTSASGLLGYHYGENIHAVE